MALQFHPGARNEKSCFLNLACGDLTCTEIG